MMESILIVDDDPDILEILRYNLEKEGYKTILAANGRDAVSLVEKNNPDLVLLDVMLPDMDGIQTCEAIRSLTTLDKHPIIAFLTARSEDYSEIAGLQAGADDYITKPIRPKVLIARIQTLLTRTKRYDISQSSIVKYENVILDKEKFTVTIDGISSTLPNKEFKLLELLISKPERVFLREEIYSLVWGNEIIVSERTIDVHIRKLREKLKERYIYTVKGIGYVFARR